MRPPGRTRYSWPRARADYAGNIPLYPYLHAYLRESRVPLLAVWGRHFLHESDLDAAAAHIRGFVGRTVL